MKKVLLTVVASVVSLSVFAQGTVIFNNLNSASGLKAPVYGPEVGNVTHSIVGNTANGLPAGTKTYTGALLSGTSYLAQIIGAQGTGKALETLAAASSAPTTFRTGSAAGYVTSPGNATLTGVAVDGPATIALVAWDNSSGQYATWAAAETAWKAGTIAAGMSAPVDVAAVGGGLLASPVLTGLQSFNIYFVPEPSTMALAGLGAAALLIFRRRK